jgi:hypothetical protein
MKINKLTIETDGTTTYVCANGLPIQYVKKVLFKAGNSDFHPVDRCWATPKISIITNETKKPIDITFIQSELQKTHYPNLIEDGRIKVKGKVICKRCRKAWKKVETTPKYEQYDHCLGKLPGVSHACCGHGVSEGYIAFENGIIIRGHFRVEDHINGVRSIQSER